MAATYTAARLSPAVDDTWGKYKIRGRRVTMAGTYATGGNAVTPQLFGLTRVLALIPLGPATDGTLAYDLTYFASTKAIILWETGSAAAGSAQKGNGESLTGIAFDVLAIGY